MITRSVLCFTLGICLLHLTSAVLHAEPNKVTSGGTLLQTSEESALPEALVLSVRGKCEFSEDGTTFTKLDKNHIFNQGAVIRTGKDASADVFFRRVGTTVRVQPNSEVKLEKMTRQMKDGAAVLNTLLDLRRGRIFTVVRSLVEGSTFEIRNAAGRSVVEGAPAGGLGRYIITADGTQVADKSSNIPIKVIGDTGITVISPGQIFSAKDGKMLPVATPEKVVQLIEFDELHALAEKISDEK
ncbi:MAG: hypothetical protein ABIQ35_01305 [Verrucomicrobiota bacterium]